MCVDVEGEIGPVSLVWTVEEEVVDVLRGQLWQGGEVGGVVHDEGECSDAFMIVAMLFIASGVKCQVKLLAPRK